MAIPTTTIKTALFNFCIAATGLANNKIVFGYQNKPEPTDDFMRIIPSLFVSGQSETDEVQYLSDGTIKVIHNRNVIAQISAFGDNAIANCSAVYDGLSKIDLYATHFDAVKLSVRNNSNLRDLTALKDGRYEGQAALDLLIDVRYHDGVIDNLDWFDTIKWQGAGSDGLISRIDEQTITGA